jgi:hypothetical protein
MNLSLAEYQALVAQSQVIERDHYGEKVLIAPDGNFIKIFRSKKTFSTAALKPYALRFWSNAEQLARLGIATVQVHSVSYCPENRRHLVEYRPLAGETLRAVLREGGDPAVLLTRFARFLAELHRRGVYFRSIHFGNVIIQLDSDEPGLIDVADMRIRSRPLGAMARTRNFRHFLRYPEDVRALEAFGLERFLNIYLETADLHGWRRMLFQRLAERTLRNGFQR